LVTCAADLRAQNYRDVFFSLDGYLLTYSKPEKDKGEKPQKYSQTGSYVWTGGRVESIAVTLARDPAFKDKYSAETLKKDADTPKEVKIKGKRALLWTIAQPKGLTEVTHRLVVLLDDDKAILIEQRGNGASLEEVGKKFDFAKVEKALATPPGKD